jgi:hypothetical protein
MTDRSVAREVARPADRDPVAVPDRTRVPHPFLEAGALAELLAHGG